MPRTRTLRVQTRVVHGHRRAFVMMGRGPALLLLHGLGCDHTTWSPVIERLSRQFTVIAPDLLGHGASDKPRADYTLGGYANGMRDLLALLGIDRVTVVGHSFGGGIAMQFAYQFPQYTERLMLVAPGGLGRRSQSIATRPDTAGRRAPCWRWRVTTGAGCGPIPRRSGPTPRTCRGRRTSWAHCRCSPASTTRRSGTPSCTCCGRWWIGAVRW